MTGVERLSLESDLWKAEVVPAWGGAMTLLQVQHEGRWRDVGRPAGERACAEADRLGMTAWPLLPYSNRIPGGVLRTRFDDRSEALRLPPTDTRFSMPIHGTGWLRPWKTEEVSPAQCRLSLAESASHWPWALYAEQCLSIEADGLHIALSVRNDGDADMPCGLGWHPYFVRTPLATLRTRFEWRDESDPEATVFHSVRRSAGTQWDGRQDVLLATLAPLDHCFGGWEGRARLTWPEWNLVMEMRTADSTMRHCVLFCPPDADFICIEPVSHASYALGTPASQALQDGIVRLAPGQTLRGEITLSVAALDAAGK